MNFVIHWNETAMGLHVFPSVWLFETLLTVAHQASLTIEFSRQEYWSRLSRPTLRDLLHPGIEPRSLVSPALTGGFFTILPPIAGIHSSFRSYCVYQPTLQALVVSVHRWKNHWSARGFVMPRVIISHSRQARDGRTLVSGRAGTSS